MKYFLSMDGGGSKTAWLLTTKEGAKMASFLSRGCSHPEIGIPNVLSEIETGINELMKKANCKKEDIACAAFGIPCYGEYPEADKVIYEELCQFLKDSKVTVCNDVELGFAGSLCLEEGIHLVAGTGAIAIGRNQLGEFARSNGWHSDFSDEGSGYWLGRKTLSLFVKQADYRIPRGALYAIIKEAFSLKDDMEIAVYYDSYLNNNRKSTAELQLLLYRAAQAGDASALNLFEQAAYELFLTIRSVHDVLFKEQGKDIKVSYSGGLFYKGNYILDYLKGFTDKTQVVLVEPYLSPVYGGILLAAQNISKEYAKRLCPILKKDMQKETNNGNNKA